MKRTTYTDAKIITADKAHELIKEKGNRWFWAAFIRKGDKKAKDPTTGKNVIVAKLKLIALMGFV